MGQTSTKKVDHPGSYQVREKIKKLGGVWDGKEKAWMVPVEHYEAAMKLCEQAPSAAAKSDGPTKAPASPVASPTAPPVQKAAAPTPVATPAPQATPVAVVNAPVVVAGPSPTRVMVRQAAIQSASVYYAPQQADKFNVFELAKEMEEWILRP